MLFRSHGTDQGVVQAVISGDLPNGSQMTGCTSVPSGHSSIEPALIQKHESFGLLKIGCEIIEERRTAFLSPLSGDQRFFYG